MLALAAGNWAEWFGAIAAGLAFLGTATALLLEVSRRQRERRETLFADALSVMPNVRAEQQSVKVFVVVENAGRHPIRDVEVEVRSAMDQPMATPPEPGRAIIPFIQAGDTKGQETALNISDLMMGSSARTPIKGRITMTFQDTAGTRWRRDAEGHVQRWRPPRPGNKGKWAPR